MLSRDQILASDDVKSAIVDVPEWPDQDGKPGQLRVRSLTAADRIRIGAIKLDGIDPRIAWIVASAVDLDGKPLFGADDIPVLMQKSVAAIDRIYKTVAALNGLGGAGVEAAEKN